MASIETAPQFYYASVTGRSHAVYGKENQDSFAFKFDSSLLWAAAIADGHGHSSHPRSAIGAKTATICALESVYKVLKESDDRDIEPDDVAAYVFQDILHQWRSKIALVHQSLDDGIVSDGMRYGLSQADYNLYGTTLAFAFPYKHLIILCSLGDSDVFCWSSDSSLRRTDVFGDMAVRLSGKTFSLCQSNAIKHFKSTVLPRVSGLSLFLATDGIRNSLPDENELNKLLAHYYDLAGRSAKSSLLEQDLVEQLQDLTVQGSGDDCTALIVYLPFIDEVAESGDFKSLTLKHYAALVLVLLVAALIAYVLLMQFDWTLSASAQRS